VFACVLQCVKAKINYISFRVTTHLENMEKSGNSKVVREKSGKMGKVRGSEIRCVFSSTKYTETGFLAGEGGRKTSFGVFRA